jgi:hypothetical protein
MERSVHGEGENEVVQGNHPVPCWWAAVRGELMKSRLRHPLPNLLVGMTSTRTGRH